MTYTVSSGTLNPTQLNYSQLPTRTSATYSNTIKYNINIINVNSVITVYYYNYKGEYPMTCDWKSL